MNKPPRTFSKLKIKSPASSPKVQKPPKVIPEPVIEPTDPTDSHDTKNSHIPNYNDLLDNIERQYKLVTASADSEAKRSSYMTTDLLVTDLLIGGGLLPGLWYTFLGGEASAKSTHLMHIQSALARFEHDRLLRLYFDYEGSMDHVYFSQMLKSLDSNRSIEDIFGERGVNGKWRIPPRVRLYPESVAEVFFNSMASLFRQLPDKIFFDHKWWYVYDNTKENRALAGSDYSKKLFSEFKKFYVPAPDGLAQAVVSVDSYPMMFPDRLDDDTEGAGLAAGARMFAENIPKIASKLRRKAVTIIGVNQLRERPAVRFGSPLYEPSGQTVKYVSSCRVQQTARAIPHGTGQIEKEPSVLIPGGEDEYRYIHAKTIKNKSFTPFLEAFYRIWTQDPDGKAYGFCPVWDCYQFLHLTGQCKGTLRKMDIDMPGVTLRKVSIQDLKALILLEGDALMLHCNRLGLDKNPKLRARCFEQLKSGVAHQRFFAERSARNPEHSDD